MNLPKSMFKRYLGNVKSLNNNIDFGKLCMNIPNSMKLEIKQLSKIYCK